MPESLQPCGLQHARLPCPSLSLRVCSDSCPLCQRCHPTISSCHPLLLLLSFFPASWSFPMSRLFVSGGQILELQFQHQSFQWIFRVDFLYDWLVWSLCCPRDSQEFSPASQIASINSLAHSLLYGLTLIFVHDYRKNHSFGCVDLCQRSYVSAF